MRGASAIDLVAIDHVGSVLAAFQASGTVVVAKLDVRSGAQRSE